MTALESCKLLLALEPADPMGALFLADYLALRAQAYGWLARMAAEWDDGADGTPGMLPNYAFSLALAAFRQEQDAAGFAPLLTPRPYSLEDEINARNLRIPT